MSDANDRRQWRFGSRQRKQARTLRTRMTDAEQRLWLELRAHRLGGLSFRRQHPIAGYVADFACLPLKLVIELDGGQHFGGAGLARDARRDRVLAEQGFRVLRFSNLDVLQNMPGVLETILAETGKGPDLPPPPPSPARGRGSEGVPGHAIGSNSSADLCAAKPSPACGGGLGGGDARSAAEDISDMRAGAARSSVDLNSGADPSPAYGESDAPSDIPAPRARPGAN